MGYRAVVLGASGFAGAELLRLVARHPGIEVAAAAASSQVGRRVGEAYPGLYSYGDLVFCPVEEALATGTDIVFSSLPHAESSRLFHGEGGPKVIDLAGDFRLHDPATYQRWYAEAHPHSESLGRWVYGLTELHRNQIAVSERVANPGCYPAATLLALAPLVASGAVTAEGIHIDAKSGISGAGRAGGEGFDFSSANENTRPYKVTGHNHIAEIEQELGVLAGGEVIVTFVPHVVPMTRGIVATCVASLGSAFTTDDLIGVLADRYSGEPFVKVLDRDSLPGTGHLAGTNLAEVTARADERTGKAIAIAAIDNLGKGAAGQALQNANLMLGFEETTALDVVGNVP